MIKNLDSLSGPLLVFGGPYSNLEATEALLAEAARLSIPPENMICTGDVIAYAADPLQTLEAVINSGMHVVMGNCEESLGFEGDDCGCGFDEGSECDLLSRQWYTHANRNLTPDHRKWMRALPRQIRFSAGASSFAVLHGGVSEISRWIFKSTPEVVKRTEISEIDATDNIDVVIAGHCGLPFIDDLGDKLWFNPGVIGMPANDGTARTWYGLIEPKGDEVHVKIRMLNYDHAQAARRMTQENLAPAYVKTLTGGLWPNMDVLGSAERAKAGLPITPVSSLWTSKRLAAAE